MTSSVTLEPEEAFVPMSAQLNCIGFSSTLSSWIWTFWKEQDICLYTVSYRVSPSRSLLQTPIPDLSSHASAALCLCRALKAITGLITDCLAHNEWPKRSAELDIDLRVFLQAPKNLRIGKSTVTLGPVLRLSLKRLERSSRKKAPLPGFRPSLPIFCSSCCIIRMDPPEWCSAEHVPVMAIDLLSNASATHSIWISGHPSTPTTSHYLESSLLDTMLLHFVQLSRSGNLTLPMGSGWPAHSAIVTRQRSQLKGN